MKILVIGRNGQLAWELRRSLSCLGEVIALDRYSPALSVDLADPETIRDGIRNIRPDLIVNSAAYTAVDKAESELELAFQINARALEVIAAAAGETGAGLVHYSTDYVFDGLATCPYTENDATSPQNVYGDSKLAGEMAIQQSQVPFLILRTSWVFGARGRNFLTTMLRLMVERAALDIVDDQRGAPTWSRHLADATALMVAACLDDGRFMPGRRSGIYHVTSAGSTTWHGFAVEIQRLATEAGLLPHPHAMLRALASAEYPTPAKRPAYSVLDNEKLWNTFRLRLPSWEESLALCIEDVTGGQGIPFP